MSSTTKICVLCVFRPALMLCSIVGFPFYSMSCDHDAEEIVLRIWLSKKCLLTAVIWLSISIYIIVWKYIQIVHGIQHQEALQTVILWISELVFMVCSVITQLHFATHMKTIPKVIQTAQLSISTFEKLTTDDVSYVQRLKVKSMLIYMYVFGASIVSSLTIIAIMKLKIILEENSNIAILFTYSFLLGMMKTMALLFFTMIRFMRYILERRNDTFIEFFDGIRARGEFSEPAHRASIANTLNTLALYNRHFYSIFRYLNTICNPLLLVWLLGAVIIVTAICFMVLSCIRSNDIQILLDYNFLILICGLTVSGALLGFVILETNNLEIANEKLISYYYRCNVSQMKTDDSLKLEALIRYSRYQKLTFVASDMYVFGINLVIPVAGIILGYVLIIFQFENTWKANN